MQNVPRNYAFVWRFRRQSQLSRTRPKSTVCIVPKMNRLLCIVCLVLVFELAPVYSSALSPLSSRHEKAQELNAASVVSLRRSESNEDENINQKEGKERVENPHLLNTIAPNAALEQETTIGGRKNEPHFHSHQHSHHAHHRSFDSNGEEGNVNAVVSGGITPSHGSSGMNGGATGTQHHYTGRNGYSNSSGEYGTHFRSRTTKSKVSAPEGQSDTVAWLSKQCVGFEPKEHLFYQIGHALLLVAFLTPHIPFGFLFLRCAAIAGCILMLFWGWFVNCSMDAVIWFGAFLSVNVVYVVVLLCKMRPVKFEREIESVYVALFKPLRVSRPQFKKVLNCMKIVRTITNGEIYAQEKITKVDSLSLVLSGKLAITQNQKAHHIVFPHQFLDSPEWFSVSTDELFQVSIVAMEESRILIWHRDKLKLSITAEPFLQAVFDHILGRDVVKKLMQVTQVSETMAKSIGYVHSGNGDDSEDKPMLKGKGADNTSHGLTALINRQLQDPSQPLIPYDLTPDDLDSYCRIPQRKRVHSKKKKTDSTQTTRIESNPPRRMAYFPANEPQEEEVY